MCNTCNIARKAHKEVELVEHRKYLNLKAPHWQKYQKDAKILRQKYDAIAGPILDTYISNMDIYNDKTKDIIKKCKDRIKVQK